MIVQRIWTNHCIMKIQRAFKKIVEERRKCEHKFLGKRQMINKLNKKNYSLILEFVKGSYKIEAAVIGEHEF